LSTLLNTLINADTKNFFVHEEGFMELKIGNTALNTITADITTLAKDAIVNAANSSLMGGGGVDGAIHRAGGPRILEECKKIVAKSGRLPTGEAVITTAGNMPAKHVIHTVGPVWHGGRRGEETLLRNAYKNSLSVAKENGVKTVAFPSISTGVYGYPVDLAAKEAVSAVLDFVKDNPDALEEITFCGFDFSTEMAYAHALEELGGGAV
jgi:O-acetyl-ADP-ribose deacetylase (regulator of RNase III)